MQDREYDYIRGNTAIAPERKTRVTEHNKTTKKHSINRNLKRALKRKNNRKYMLGTVVLVSILGFITISMDGKVYNMQKQVRVIESEISSTGEDNEALKVKILKYSSLSNINDSAESKLGMYIPQSGDVVKMDFSENYFEDINKTKENTEKTSLFSKITNLLK